MFVCAAYFKRGEYNIITVDWGLLAKEPCYWEAAHNVDTVAQCAAELLDMVYKLRSEVSINNTHIVGFSLGAHTAANVASHLKSGKVTRLTGSLYSVLSDSKQLTILSSFWF